MARTPEGTIIVRKTKSRGRSYSIRLQTNGQRYFWTLGHSDEGWNDQKAELERLNVIADIRRGSWSPPAPDTPPAVEPDVEQSFWQFASAWFESCKGGWSENTRRDYEWQTSQHLLPFFADHKLSDITIAEVDRYTHTKLQEDRLSPVSINKTLVRLGQILERATEYELIEKNPVKIGKRKLKVKRYARSYIDNADHIEALLQAARELDEQARVEHGRGRTILISLLLFTGVRISEACALRWRDVDLANGRLRVPGTKSDAAVRWVQLLPALRDELVRHKMTSDQTDPDMWVVTTAVGTRRTKDNARQRVWLPVIERANQHLLARDLPPLPDGVTQHSLRMTCCSLRLAMGEDLAHVAEQLGHGDTSVTHRYYLRVMRMDSDHRARLRALVDGAGPLDLLEINGPLGMPSEVP